VYAFMGTVCSGVDLLNCLVAITRLFVFFHLYLPVTKNAGGAIFWTNLHPLRIPAAVSGYHPSSAKLVFWTQFIIAIARLL